ncbi:hypothetical protein JCM4914_52420 [Streptomyces platensis subsp. malvinus]
MYGRYGALLRGRYAALSHGPYAALSHGPYAGLLHEPCAAPFPFRGAHAAQHAVHRRARSALPAVTSRGGSSPERWREVAGGRILEIELSTAQAAPLCKGGRTWLLGLLARLCPGGGSTGQSDAHGSMSICPLTTG